MTDASRPAPASPEEVERNLRRTRAELALTFDALDRKLTARHLMEKGIDMFRDTLAQNDAVSRSLDLVRANPVPFALIGLGAAWLIASNTGVVDRIAQDERVEAARRRVAGLASDVGARAGELASDVAGRVGIGGSGGGADRALGHTGNAMVDQTGQGDSDGWMHQMTGIAQGALRTARDSSGEMLNRAGNYAGDGAGRIADQLSDAFERHPLVVGAVGIMAGALVAALLPVTQFEDELVGDAREQLWTKAQEAGQQAVSRVREAASKAAVRAVDAATEAATQTATETVRNELRGSSQG